MARAVRRSISTVAAERTPRNHRVPAHASSPNLRVFVHYEMYDDAIKVIPAYRKLVSIRNDGSDTVTVDSLVVELFRAQNFAPQRITALAERWANSQCRTTSKRPAVPDSLLRDVAALLVRRSPYDQCCDDSQLHVPSTRLILAVGHPSRVRSGELPTTTAVLRRHPAPCALYGLYFPSGNSTPSRRGQHRSGVGPLGLGPGARTSRSSSSIRLILHTTMTCERQGLGVRETLKAIAPRFPSTRPPRRGS